MQLTVVIWPFISVAAVASALVVPDAPGHHQAPLIDLTATPDKPHDPSPWWGKLPFKGWGASARHDSVARLAAEADSAVRNPEDFLGKFEDQLQAHLTQALRAGSGESASSDDGGVDDGGDDGVEARGHHDFPDLTLYQLIHLSNYTTKFAKLVDEHPRVVQLLNGTGVNHTLFVPVDRSFDRSPDDHDEPDKALVEQALLYHVALGSYPVRRILHTHTLPSALHEDYFLGGESQRLRTSVGLTGVRVNFHSKLVAADIGAKNGLLHAVDGIIIPPKMIGRELTLLPGTFSTLLLAYEKTDFVRSIHRLVMHGTTVIAPSNRAFSRLGPRVNAFLFNTETGLKYLRALLDYHIAPNVTLYSDAFYDKTDNPEVAAQTRRRKHYALPTLLDGAQVAVDTARWGGFISMRVNGFAKVVAQDVIAKNGVIQVVDRVVLPPHKHKQEDMPGGLSGELGVEELMERLAPYIDLP